MDGAGSWCLSQALGLTFVRMRLHSSAGRTRGHHSRLLQQCMLYIGQCTVCYTAAVVADPTATDEMRGLNRAQLGRPSLHVRPLQASALPHLQRTATTAAGCLN
ncbi:hypothetical protein NDU88_004290 [Pleurodeles waltl]|uniref:Uncharacterized protein n=1 Tax=Pleurodeles waltl TaxID=8319 RepID=A0AAV7RJ62_PLEWA|nr:hypothetical protein NDU88_004290 [Pleurodeles waltl]